MTLRRLRENKELGGYFLEIPELGVYIRALHNKELDGYFIDVPDSLFAPYLPYVTYNGATWGRSDAAGTSFGSINTSPYSWGMLISLSAPYAASNAIWSNMENGFSGGWSICTLNGQAFCRWAHGGGSPEEVSTAIGARPTLELLKAYLIVGTYTSGTLRTYVNGVLVDTSTTATTGDLGSGIFKLGSSEPFGNSASPLVRIHGCSFIESLVLSNTEIASWAADIKSLGVYRGPQPADVTRDIASWIPGPIQFDVDVRSNNGSFIQVRNFNNNPTFGIDPAVTLAW